MFGPVALTHFVYVVGAIAFCLVALYAVLYSRRQSRIIRDIECEQHRSLGVEEGIALALHRRDEELHRHAH